MSQPELAPARPHVAIALACLMQGVGGGLGWSLLPPLMPVVAKDLGVSHAMGGVVWGAASLGIAVASPLGGAAVDRFGPRRVAGVAMLAGALACASRAIATGPWSLAATMAIFGAHIAFVAPALPKFLASHVPLGRLGRANGLSLLAYTLGTAITVLTARAVVAPMFGGWRPAMVAAAIAMVGAAVAWLALARDRLALSPHARLSDSLRLARDPQLLRVAGAHFLLFGGYLALLGMLPRALSERGLPLERVGLAVAGWLGAAAVGNLLGPIFSDAIGRRRPFLIFGSLVAGAGLVGVAALPHSMTLLCLAVAALGGGSFAPLLFSMPLEMRSIGPARAGAALGLLMLVGQLGGFLLPVISGVAQEHGGFAAAMMFLAAAHLLIRGTAIGLRETGTATAKIEEGAERAEDVALQQSRAA